MTTIVYEFVSLDLLPLLTAILCACSCAVVGTFLVLRKQVMMGDAISHAVLPGIVGAFLVFGSRDSFVVFCGAAIAGLLSALFIEAIQRLASVERGAAMGVVFSVFFAFGVILLEQAGARSVDLDADCLLHGQLESLIWFPTAPWLSIANIALIPSPVLSSGAVLLFVCCVTALFYKELTLASFDPEFSFTIGYSPTKMNYLLMFMVAGAVIASFEAVGSILVIASLVCPPAAARMWTDKLKIQLNLSVLFAIIGVIIGYLSASRLPILFGYGDALNTAGMIAVTQGVILLSSIMFAFRYGVIPKGLREHALKRKILAEDLLGILYRAQEIEPGRNTTIDELLRYPLFNNQLSAIIERLERSGQLLKSGQGIGLTMAGVDAAKGLVRNHRLWESFLVKQMGLRVDHVHERAMELEHFTEAELAKDLATAVDNPLVDPQGKIIPK